MKKSQVVEIDGREVTFSNVDKVMYPGNDFTKAQIIDYYVRVSRFILPHLKNRPLTLKRYPEGVTGEFFYEKNAPRFAPPWLKTFEVARRHSEGAVRFVMVNDLASLVWVANLASLELHVFLAKSPKLDRPTAMVFDLDPGAPADFLTCAQIAVRVRDILEDMGLKSWVKSSGSKGLQLYAPFNTSVTYDQTQSLAKQIAETLAEKLPDRVVAKMAKNLRDGKVFIDWSQNSEHKTTVCIYSLRAKHEEPFVSFPLDWDQLEKALKEGDLEAFLIRPEEALKRLEREGDLFADVLVTKQKFPTAKKITSALEKVSTAPSESPARKNARLKGVGDRSIRAYQAKRDFTQTPEPAAADNPKRKANGKVKASGNGKAGPDALKNKTGKAEIFVIQKHDASRLHYDFRLGMDGVLKSWAVPKGPPYTKGERRLAMHVEDHPMSYKDFEGTIAPGNYGAGTVMVWDSGTYELMDGSMEQGKLHFRLHGKKLEGEWILVKGRTEEKSGEPWFLIKGGEPMEPLSPQEDDSSSQTGRSMERIAKANDRQWKSNRSVSLSRGSASRKK